jgi:hypothetical protein
MGSSEALSCLVSQYRGCLSSFSLQPVTLVPILAMQGWGSHDPKPRVGWRRPRVLTVGAVLEVQSR